MGSRPAASYSAPPTLSLYQRTMFEDREPENERLPDLNMRELATFALLALAVWIGLYPAPFLRRLDTSVQRIVSR
jgi:NADH:ubiquinone oxidoreductase subunit 4 (subunit M)